MRFYRPLLILATLLAFGVVSLGAYVRLSDAGLGCPDWPGCYGHLIGVPEQAHEQSAALQAFPGKPVEAHKAWKEMVHRYFAGLLGLLILAIAWLAWRYRQALQASPVLPTVLLAVVGFQAMLGMWTVTLLLKPVIVTGHLLGGMTTLALLVWLLLRQSMTAPPPAGRSIAPDRLDRPVRRDRPDCPRRLGQQQLCGAGLPGFPHLSGGVAAGHGHDARLSAASRTGTGDRRQFALQLRR